MNKLNIKFKVPDGRTTLKTLIELALFHMDDKTFNKLSGVYINKNKLLLKMRTLTLKKNEVLK